MIIACAVLCISIDLLMWCFFRLLLYRFLSVHICSALFVDVSFSVHIRPIHRFPCLSRRPSLSGPFQQEFDFSVSVVVYRRLVVRPPLNRCLLFGLHSSVCHWSSMFGRFKVSDHLDLAIPAIPPLFDRHHCWAVVEIIFLALQWLYRR